MNGKPRHLTLMAFVLFAAGYPCLAAGQIVGNEIGLSSLRARLGGASPTGAGVPAMLVEGLTGPNAYMPDSTTPELAGKSITDRSGSGVASVHATSVASIGFGGLTGIAPGVSRIDAFKIDFSLTPGDWLAGSYLNFGGGHPIVADDLRVQNHSWAAGATFDPSTLEVMRRLDFAVRRDNVVAVAGIANTRGGPVPPMLGNCYNAIIVGNSNGNSSHGPGGGDVPGRSKPDITGPYGVSSYSTPVVAGCAALLLETADTLGNANRARAETIKAILLSGATKVEFSGLANPWNRVNNGSFVEPLDRRFGAGEVNIDHSHYIISENEKNGADQLVDGRIGWDFETLAGEGDSRRYYLDFGNATDISLSATATWLRRVAPTGTGANLFATSDASLAHLELRLFEVNPDLSYGALVDSSVSPIDNVQHLFQASLPGNRMYALEVYLAGLPSGQASENFALAWYSEFTSVPEPGGAWVILMAGTAVLLPGRRRNQSRLSIRLRPSSSHPFRQK